MFQVIETEGKTPQVWLLPTIDEPSVRVVRLSV